MHLQAPYAFMPKPNDSQSFREEIANSVIHGIGLALGVAALSILVVFACKRGTSWHIVSCSIYGSTLVLLYLSSTLYHSFQNPKAKKIFKRIDHCSIYLLIAGTYTPFTLVNLRGSWGWTLFGIIWGLAVFGILFKIFHTGKFRFVSTLVYLAMGWLIIIAIKPLFSSMSLTGFLWLLAGGLSYSFGVIFYAFDRISFFHAIWHLFVLGGSVCHFFAVLYHVLPPV